MSRLLSDELRAALSALVTARLGLRYPPDRWDDLEDGARAACRQLGVVDVVAWVRSLLSGVPTFAQLQTLANQLTVGETYFFRQGEVFRVVQEQVLRPLIAARRGRNQTLNVWSAACSSGEEPYSLAILLRETMVDPAGWQINLLGTDVNTRSLGRAAHAVYSNWSFRDAPAWLKGRYFKPAARGAFELVPTVRSMVRFSYLNLVDDPYPVRPGGFDVIFCRNALMYFTAEWQEVIMHRLWHALAEDGVLVVGPCDTHPVLARRFRVSRECPTLYRKAHDVRGEPAAFPTPHDLPEIASPPLPVVPPRLEREAHSPAAVDVHRSEIPTPPESPEEVRELEDEYQLAHREANGGSLAEALRHCDRALARDKLSPAVHYLRGCVLQEMGRLDDAVAAHRRVVFLDPQFVVAHLALGSLLRQHGQPEAARQAFLTATQILGRFNRGDAIPGADGLTAARLQAVAAAELEATEIA
jgi:chemotaxis protein methyltransferase CheR